MILWAWLFACAPAVPSDPEPEPVASERQAKVSKKKRKAKRKRKAPPAAKRPVTDEEEGEGPGVMEALFGEWTLTNYAGPKALNNGLIGSTVIFTLEVIDYPWKGNCPEWRVGGTKQVASSQVRSKYRLTPQDYSSLPKEIVEISLVCGHGTTVIVYDPVTSPGLYIPGFDGLYFAEKK